MDDLIKLITQAQAGDKDAFGQIYELFYPRIYRYCQFNLDRELAQDLCQETFLRAWKALPSFSHKKGGSFQAFLFKIARNLIIDFARKKKEFPLRDYQEIETNEELAEQTDREFEKERLGRALSQLADSERQIIILRYFEEMTVFEVAKIVGVREGALRVRVHRILKKLKDLIENHD
ncbi:RNA polymerase sigma factor [Candidatus Curtissbacteria bacterium]|nr:RNA polymerase sigma factor [Candidatus Curtissbacteria bacterium]